MKTHPQPRGLTHWQLHMASFSRTFTTMAMRRATSRWRRVSWLSLGRRGRHCSLSDYSVQACEGACCVLAPIRALLQPELTPTSMPHPATACHSCAAGTLILGESEAGPSASYELVLAGGGGGHGGVGTKIIGSREFARYYRQVGALSACRWPFAACRLCGAPLLREQQQQRPHVTAGCAYVSMCMSCATA